jgi:signal transduction histidine kinase/CheY-like chemotaxis protein
MLLFLQFRERQSRAQRIADRMTTDLRATQDELRAALSRSQEVSKTKGEFLAVMSHELRTPLNGVIGMTSLLLNSGLDAQQRDFAETARSCANGLLDIINDILDYSKLEAGKIQVESLPFDPHDLVEEVLQVVADRAQAKNLVLVSEVDPRVGDRLRGDPSRVRQLLLNLISNAVKFTERGEVVLSMRLAHDDETTPRIRLEVRDSGIGIPAEHLDGLFKPFTQADSSISRRFGGTGLGLAICKRLAEALGGVMSVTSTVGKGSVFAAELPFRREEPSDTSEPPTELVGRLALIIDPHPISRAATAAILGDFGCEVLAVASIDLAGPALGEAIPDLIVSDTGRNADPGLVATLRAIPVRRGAEVPVLLLVPFSFAARTDEPGIATVTKPVRRRSLRDAAQALLRGVPNTGSTRTPRRFAGLAVLVADERLGNLRILSALLTELGCRVDLAADADETVAAAKRVDYAVIILAADLPPRGAADTANALRQIGSRATLIASGTDTLPAGCHATMRSTPRAAVLARLLTQAALNR